MPLLSHPSNWFLPRAQRQLSHLRPSRPDGERLPDETASGREDTRAGSEVARRSRTRQRLGDASCGRTAPIGGSTSSRPYTGASTNSAIRSTWIVAVTRKCMLPGEDHVVTNPPVRPRRLGRLEHVAVLADHCELEGHALSVSGPDGKQSVSAKSGLRRAVLAPYRREDARPGDRLVVCGRGECEELPGAGYAFEYVGVSIGDVDARSRDKVAHCLRDENFARGSS